VKLWDAEAEGLIEKGGAADGLWRLLESKTELAGSRQASCWPESARP